ncbi:MAG: class II fumarate hydratase [Loigolactobacillus coryniformis]|uniref:class II fumarate hydratase n=1 Tax=Loigolactobacillus coryniformis TaxID=1610 RepID=UPI00264930A1|nr:class II fumarate hydratase [Loigolactobacillus coryniformis]MDN5953613.1 class II fumarate hydratase [Loigolactobacillus coryniformis]
MSDFRLEHDSLGPVKVPQSVLWGAQTERSRQNFQTGGPMPYPVIKALLQIKKAAAKVNSSLSEIDPAKATLIEETVDQLLKQDHRKDFPLVVYQTGSGTQTNMNVNEVIVHYAAQIAPDLPLSPNDDVNHAQSSNDTFPAAMMIAAYQACVGLLPVLTQLITAFQKKQTEFATIVKIGRTHLQDATPLTVGQEISGWISALEHDQQYLKQNMATLLELPLGGTAVGTGLNTPANFDQKIVADLAATYQIPFIVAPNKFQGLANHSGLNMIHGCLRTLASDLLKIGNDIRFLASGPRAGYGELIIQANEPGSSIMPGKVNPTQVEALTMVVARIMGNDTTLNFAASQGNFEMNVYKPIIIATFLESTELLTSSIHSLTEKLVKGLQVNAPRMQALVENSLMLVTALTPHIGYEKSAQIAQSAQKQGTTLREAALVSGAVTATEFDQWVKPAAMTHPAP